MKVVERGKPSKEAVTASLRILARIIARDILEDRVNGGKEWTPNGERDEGPGDAEGSSSSSVV